MAKLTYTYMFMFYGRASVFILNETSGKYPAQLVLFIIKTNHFQRVQDTYHAKSLTSVNIRV